MENYIFDIVLVLVAASIIILTAKKGFVLSLLGTVSVVLSGFLSYKFTKPVTEFIYSSFLYDKIEDKLTDVLLNLSQDSSFDDKIQAMVGSLPEGVLNLSQGLGFEIDAALSTITQELFTNEDIIKAFMDNFASDIITSVLEVVVFVVLFILLSFVLKYASALFSKIVKKIPVVGKLNTLLGGGLGIIKAIIAVSIICLAICPLVFVIDVPWLKEVISDSYVYQFIIKNNPFNNFVM
jgi:uncharacterized membrane protein required for colicin V production